MHDEIGHKRRDDAFFVYDVYTYHATGSCPGLDTSPGGATLCDVQEDQAAACDIEAAEEAVFTEQLHAAIEEALQKLTEREADVIRRRYYGNQGQRQIAQVYGVSSTRVQQLEKTAFTKLRRNRRLIQWCDEVILSSAWRGIGFSA